MAWTDEERHAFFLGAMEIACPWPPRYKFKPEEAEFKPYKEYHYYTMGRAVALRASIVVDPLIIASMIKLIGVIL